MKAKSWVAPAGIVQTETVHVEAIVRFDQVILTVAAPALAEGFFHLSLPDARILCITTSPDLSIEVPLPVDVDRGWVSATCSNGVLEIRLARSVPVGI